jgi:predicted PurR-regulated permease PerM
MLASRREERLAGEGFYSKVFGLALTALLAYLLFRIFQPFIGPILWAVLLAMLLFPANRALRRRLKGRKAAAALALTVGVTLVIVLPGALLAVAFAGQATDLARRISATAERYRIVKPSDVLRLPVLEQVIRWLDQKIPVTAEQIQDWVIQGVQGLLQFALEKSRFLFLGALGAVVGLTLMVFILYFFFRDGEEMATRAVRLVPLDERRKRRLVTHLSEVVRAVVYGSLLTALVQGSLVGVAFAISGLPSPIVFGVIATIASLIPVVGTGLVVAPAAVVLAAQGRWGWAIFMVAWGVLLVGMADNFLRPLFISGRAEISTLPIFFGVIGGLAAFGPIGLFLGPVLIALALALIRFAEEGKDEAATPAASPPQGIASGRADG